MEKICKKQIPYYNTDVCDEKEMEKIFQKHHIEGVFHFSGLKSVKDSIKHPIDYYHNNVVSTLILTKLCKKYNVNRIIFSSSATVYGDNNVPFTESMKLLPTTNPYGETKVMSEKILKDVAKSNDNLAVSILRYFNPVGAHKSGLIGEYPKNEPNNIMPYITKVANGELSYLEIYGNDYPTIDGTGVRDFIHVTDLAKGHIAAYIHLKKGVEVYNLGSGEGTSVLQLINTFEKVNKVDIPYKIVNRRPGDIALCYADTSKVNEELNWEVEYSIETMCRDIWNFMKSNK